MVRSFAAELMERNGNAFQAHKMKTRVAAVLRRCLPIAYDADVAALGVSAFKHAILAELLSRPKHG